ncbi:flagellin N-terminal helical domain-containing protein [Sporanaerobacter acetigenes]|uniref:Flagellin n=1 Tax=Sporanaerobacter acetigenes DSM 13106 TaxID=1123281 RepID=A0A1M5ST40_9FIRM|nr:flagellin [Sporanaerobacter acetigenes]SHH41656.1 flagellin [Sporanaerobacter acetigenes DSM 13106]
MRINNNLMAMNTHRQLGINNTGTAKSLEKLSSGFRINRAGDDAAGLAISEKMRGQIRGLTQASRNAQDGISLIQTAEGGLNESHAILQRMRELAVQSATDTNVEIDRGAIQDEMNQLVSELDRISNTTEFNTQGLLNGSFKGKFQIGANEGQNVELQIGKMDSTSLGLVSTISTAQGDTANNTNNAVLADGVYTVNEAKNALLDADGNTVATIATSKITAGGAEVIDLTSKEVLDAGAQITISGNGAKYDIKNKIDAAASSALAPGNYEIKGTNLVKDGKLVGTVADKVSVTPEGGSAIEAAKLGLTGDLLTDGFKFTINGSDVSTRANAEGSITTINKAIETVSAERSKLGAMQNRLEHTIKNLDTSAENLQASESRIRDVDMAKEMMEFTKQNILQQAATAMLAQANQAPQTVLQLLR